MSTTETPRGERMAAILLHLIRNRHRKFSVADMHGWLTMSEPVILRNVQRDMKVLAERHDDVIGVERRKNRRYYFVKPDMRDKMSLPIERNGLLALFLLKRLQSFFDFDTGNMERLSEGIAELSSRDDYDLFEDLDQRLSETTFFLGERSLFNLRGTMLNDLLTALVTRRKVATDYRGSAKDKPVPRTICPVKLILYKGELYFICISERHTDRDYYIKLSRIVTATLLDEQFVVPKARRERIEKRLSSSFGMLDEDDPRPRNVTLKFPGYMKLLLSERQFHPSQKLREDTEGSVILTMRAPVDKDLLQWVLGWSDTVQVLKPVSLRRDLAGMGTFLRRTYGEG
mgnify:CR=1 FL=1